MGVRVGGRWKYAARLGLLATWIASLTVSLTLPALAGSALQALPLIVIVAVAGYEAGGRKTSDGDDPRQPPPAHIPLNPRSCFAGAIHITVLGITPLSVELERG